MNRLSEQTHRMFARVDAVLEAIENGEDPRPAVRKLDAATPWDVIRLGQAFVLDVIDREQVESPEHWTAARQPPAVSRGP